MEQSQKRVAAAESGAGGATVVDSDPSGAESLASSFQVGVGEVYLVPVMGRTGLALCYDPHGLGSFAAPASKGDGIVAGGLAETIARADRRAENVSRMTRYGLCDGDGIKDSPAVR